MQSPIVVEVQISGDAHLRFTPDAPDYERTPCAPTDYQYCRPGDPITPSPRHALHEVLPPQFQREQAEDDLDLTGTPPEMPG